MLEFHEGNASGGEITVSSNVEAITVAKENNAERININFSQMGENQRGVTQK